MALGTRALAAIGAAVAASALIAMLLLGGRDGGGAAAPPVENARPAPVPPAAAAPMTRADAAALAVDDNPPSDSPPPEAAGPSVEVRVLLDGVQPVPGCPVMGAEQDADGELLASFGDDGPRSGETDAEGCFVLRWSAEPKHRLLAVFLDRGAKVGRVEGATRLGALSGGQAVLLAGTEPVTVHLEDDGGPPRIRILDDATGAAIPAEVAPVIDYGIPEAPPPHQVGRAPLQAESGGWWSAQRVPVDGIAPRVRAAGYRDAPLEGWDGSGRRTVRLLASGSGVRGVLEAPPGTKNPLAVSVHRVDPPREDLRPPLGGVRTGPFLLDGLELGEWEIEVQWRAAAGEADSAAWTVLRFRYEGGILDLGTLSSTRASSLRVRWAASAPVDPGTPIAIERVSGRGMWRFGSHFAKPDEKGEILFAGLRPGDAYELYSGNVPGWRERVTAPAEPGAEGEFEAGRDLRLVKCRFTFTVDGAAPSPPIPQDRIHVSGQLDTGTRVFTTEMAPGRHRIPVSILGTADESEARASARLPRPHMVLLFADIEVPDAPEFEATVDFKSKQ